MGVSYGAAVALQTLPQLPHVRAVWSEGCFSRFDRVVQNQFAWLPAQVRGPIVNAYRVLAWLDCGFWENEINPVRCLEETSVPICFCHGVEDPLIPFAEAKALHDAYAGPKWHYWVANAGHDNLRQQAPAEYRRRLTAFFGQVLTPEF